MSACISEPRAWLCFRRVRVLPNCMNMPIPEQNCAASHPAMPTLRIIMEATRPASTTIKWRRLRPLTALCALLMPKGVSAPCRPPKARRLWRSTPGCLWPCCATAACLSRPYTLLSTLQAKHCVSLKIMPLMLQSILPLRKKSFSRWKPKEAFSSTVIS